MSGWRLLVWKAPANDPMLTKMGLRPTKKNPSVLYGRYHESAEPQLHRHIDMLRRRKLRGKAKRDPNINFIGRGAPPSPAPDAPIVAGYDAAGHETSGRPERKAVRPGTRRSRPSSPAPKSASATPLLGYTEPTSRLVKRSSSQALAVPLGASLQASR